MADIDNASVITALRAPFNNVGRVPVGGGQQADYIEWTDAVIRLNETVGEDNWDWHVSDPTFLGDAQAGFAICKGSLTIRFPDGTTSTKEQFGGNEYGRGMTADNAIKGAGSDALKKAASLFGIAFELAGKSKGGTSRNGGQDYDGPRTSRPSASRPQPADDGEEIYCEECGEPLTETQFRDGKVWTPADLARYGRNKFGRALDMTCYRAANDAKKRAENNGSLPF